MDNIDMDHDHFLQCEASEKKKESRLKAVVEHLSKLKTPDITKYAIIQWMTGFDNNIIVKKNRRRNTERN